MKIDASIKLYIDASALRCFESCREMYRRRYIENIVPQKPAIHLEFGRCFHLGIEAFWKGLSYDESFAAASQAAQQLDQSYLNMKEREKWQEMKLYLPELLGVYYEQHDQEGIQLVAQIDGKKAVELEWELPFSIAGYPVLCGKIDRVMQRDWYISLIDNKTTSAFGQNWADDFYQEKSRDIGLALYDWYLRQVGMTPHQVIIEAAVKPYYGKTKDRRAAYRLFDMVSIIHNRKRFDSLLRWRVAELLHYMGSYGDSNHWPMSDGEMCRTKYGFCDYIHLCNEGNSPGNLNKFKPREEHLQLRVNLCH